MSIVRAIGTPMSAIPYLALLGGQAAQAGIIPSSRESQQPVAATNPAVSRPAAPNEKWARNTDKQLTKWRVIGPKSDSSDVKSNPVAPEVTAENADSKTPNHETIQEKFARFTWKSPGLNPKDPANASLLQVSAFLSTLSQALGLACMAWLVYLCFSTNPMWGIGTLILPAIGTLFCLLNFDIARNLVLLMLVSFLMSIVGMYIISPQLAFTVVFGFSMPGA